MKPYPCVISICATVARRAQISQGRLVTDDHHPAPTFTPPELPKKVHVRALPNAAGNFKSTESIQFLFYHLLLSSILYLYLDFFIMTFTANTNQHRLTRAFTRTTILITFKFCKTYSTYSTYILI